MAKAVEPPDSLDWEIVHWARPLMQLQSGGLFLLRRHALTCDPPDLPLLKAQVKEGRGANCDWRSNVLHPLITWQAVSWLYPLVVMWQI